MTLPEVALRQLTRAEVERRAGELVMLQRAAYAVEAELIGDDRIPQLSETPEELAMAGLTWNVVEAGGLIVAAIAHSETSEGIDIERLVVHPSWHRRGLGRQLVTRIIRGFATVSTGTKNQPARRLYESMGFRHVRDDEVLPGLWVSTYEHA
jgi:GNAT superfamily N-acetyltransferase